MSLTADHKGILLSSRFPEETEAALVSNLPEIIPVGFAGVLTTVVFRRVNLIISRLCLKSVRGFCGLRINPFLLRLGHTAVPSPS